jgi:magnesium chelatase subunit D
MNARVGQIAVVDGPVRPGDDLAFALAACAVDPEGLGGIRLRGRPSPLRDSVLASLRTATTTLTVPLHVGDDRLLGGVCLAQTLRASKVVWERGLLERAHGGFVVVTMAERIAPRVCTALCGVLDRGTLAIEREGQSRLVECRIGVVLLDEGVGDEIVAASLRDRVAFSFDLDELSASRLDVAISPARVAQARVRLPSVTIDDLAVEALVAGAASVGVTGERAVILAARVARTHAALCGRDRVDARDLDVAARLVLGPRATRLAPPEVDDATPTPSNDDVSADEATTERCRPDASKSTPDADEDQHTPAAGLGEIVVDAARCGIPEDLLRTLAVGPASRRVPSPGVGAGARRVVPVGGRPAGTIADTPRDGRRLALLETLRAAAPRQRLRAAERPAGAPALQIRREDLRVHRQAARTETCVIFTVDASGSAALRRLDEAKGAVERLLLDCYSRRDHVALIAFRASGAEVVLPPTRSLSRVRRRLADLAGGGATPLAAGLDAALALADDARRRGRTPIVVVLTDGRGNVARDGRNESTAANEDAIDGAKRLRAAGVTSLVLDTSTRPQSRVRSLASAMSARYLPLPRFDPGRVARHVRALAQEVPSCR